MYSDLIHRLPAVKSLCFTFVGPGVDVDEQEYDEGWLRVPNCEDCENGGRSVRYQALRMKYEEYKQSALFQEPQLVLVQNCGFSEYSDQGNHLHILYKISTEMETDSFCKFCCFLLFSRRA